MGCCGGRRVQVKKVTRKSATSTGGVCGDKVRMKYTGPEKYVVTKSGNGYGILATGSVLCVLKKDAEESFFEKV